MIFLSHNYKDKEFVDVIAYRLKDLYGKENIFYDEWSIRPGENILSEMSEGIKQCRFFFYFITENSLKSEMVNLEWTSALMKKSEEKIEFIPIRADNVNPPDIIRSLKYLDLYTNGLEVTITQMIEIITGEEITKKTPTFDNLQAYIHEVSPLEVHFYITVKRFFEPSSKFLVLSNLNNQEASLEKVNGVHSFGYVPGIDKQGDVTLNGFTIDVLEGVKKGFPIHLAFKMKKPGRNIIYLYRYKDANTGIPIPVKMINDPKEILK